MGQVIDQIIGQVKGHGLGNWSCQVLIMIRVIGQVRGQELCEVKSCVQSLVN